MLIFISLGIIVFLLAVLSIVLTEQKCFTGTLSSASRKQLSQHSGLYSAPMPQGRFMERLLASGTSKYSKTDSRKFLSPSLTSIVLMMILGFVGDVGAIVTPMVDRESLLDYTGGMELWGLKTTEFLKREEGGTASCDDQGCSIDQVFDFDLRLSTGYTTVFDIDVGPAYVPTKIYVSVPQCITEMDYEYYYSDTGTMIFTSVVEGNCDGGLGDLKELKSPDGRVIDEGSLSCSALGNLAWVSSEGSASGSTGQCAGIETPTVCQRRLLDPRFDEGMSVFTPDLVNPRIDCKVCVGYEPGENCMQVKGVVNDRVSAQTSDGKYKIEIDTMPIASPLVQDALVFWFKNNETFPKLHVEEVYVTKTYPELGSPVGQGLGMTQRTALPINGDNCPTVMTIGPIEKWTPEWKLSPGDKGMCGTKSMPKAHVMDINQKNNCSYVLAGEMCSVDSPTGLIYIFCEEEDCFFDDTRAFDNGEWQFTESGSQIGSLGDNYLRRSMSGKVYDCGKVTDYDGSTSRRPSDCKLTNKTVVEPISVGGEHFYDVPEDKGSERRESRTVTIAVVTGFNAMIIIHLFSNKGRGFKSRVPGSKLGEYTKIGNRFIRVTKTPKMGCAIAAIICLIIAVLAITTYLVTVAVMENNICCATSTVTMKTDRFSEVAKNMFPAKEKLSLYSPVITTPSMLDSGKISLVTARFDGLNKAPAHVRLTAEGVKVSFNNDLGVMKGMEMPTCKVVLGGTGSTMTVNFEYDGVPRMYSIASNNTFLYENSVSLSQGVQSLKFGFSGLSSKLTVVDFSVPELGAYCNCKDYTYADGTPDGGDDRPDDSDDYNPFDGVNWPDIVFGDIGLGTMVTALWIIAGVVSLILLLWLARAFLSTFKILLVMFGCAQGFTLAPGYQEVGLVNYNLNAHRVISYSNTSFPGGLFPYGELPTKEFYESNNNHGEAIGCLDLNKCGLMRGVDLSDDTVSCDIRYETKSDMGLVTATGMVTGFSDRLCVYSMAWNDASMIHIVSTEVIRTPSDTLYLAYVESVNAPEEDVLDAIINTMGIQTLEIVMSTHSRDLTFKSSHMVLHDRSPKVKHSRDLDIGQWQMITTDGLKYNIKLGGPMTVNCISKSTVEYGTDMLDRNIKVFCRNKRMMGILKFHEKELIALDQTKYKGLVEYNKFNIIKTVTNFDLRVQPVIEQLGFPVVDDGKVTCSSGKCLITTGDWGSFRVIEAGEVLPKFFTRGSFTIWYDNREFTYKEPRGVSKCQCKDFKSCYNCLKEGFPWVFFSSVCLAPSVVIILVIVMVGTKVGRRFIRKGVKVGLDKGMKGAKVVGSQPRSVYELMMEAKRRKKEMKEKSAKGD